MRKRNEALEKDNELLREEKIKLMQKIEMMSKDIMQVDNKISATSLLTKDKEIQLLIKENKILNERISSYEKQIKSMISNSAKYRENVENDINFIRSRSQNLPSKTANFISECKKEVKTALPSMVEENFEIVEKKEIIAQEDQEETCSIKVTKDSESDKNVMPMQQNTKNNDYKLSRPKEISLNCEEHQETKVEENNKEEDKTNALGKVLQITDLSPRSPIPLKERLDTWSKSPLIVNKNSLPSIKSTATSRSPDQYSNKKPLFPNEKPKSEIMIENFDSKGIFRF